MTSTVIEGDYNFYWNPKVYLFFSQLILMYLHACVYLRVYQDIEERKAFLVAKESFNDFSQHNRIKREINEKIKELELLDGLMSKK